MLHPLPSCWRQIKRICCSRDGVHLTRVQSFATRPRQLCETNNSLIFRAACWATKLRLSLVQSNRKRISYFDALEEIAAVRAAEAKGEFMPDWVPYSESEVCQLCKSDFSWASTSKSEVREWLKIGTDRLLELFWRAFSRRCALQRLC